MAKRNASSTRPTALSFLAGSTRTATTAWTTGASFGPKDRSIQLQRRSVELFEALLAEAAPERRQQFEDYLDYARRHREVIARFGRFPHRNATLGRASTPQETLYLAQPGAGF